MNKELKPCPFCGHDDITIRKEMKNFIFKDGTPMRGMWYEAECEYCGCHLGPAPSMEMLVENWNTRTDPEQKKGEWLPHPHEREWDVCSVCGTGCKRREYEMQFGQERFTEYGYQYCPHCGADMRGE